MARRWTATELASLPGVKIAAEAGAPASALGSPAPVLRRPPAPTLDDRFATELAIVRLDRLFTREHRFHDSRRWRLDFYCATYSLGIEMDGGGFAAGRHTRGAGFREDCIKLNAAIEQGISVLRFTDWHLHQGRGIAQVMRILESRGWQANA